jgi:two-component system, chemotaxis family, chemotaxis protein CheY
MINLDNELAEEYMVRCRAHLAGMESDLLALEKAGLAIDDERVNRIYQAVHAVKGGASFFDLLKIHDVASQTENAVALIRSRKVVPTPDRINVLLRATDKLHDLIQNAAVSNQADISQIMTALSGLGAERPATAVRPLRTLVAEDDFSSRLLLQTFLSGYGDCNVAVNGREAVEAVHSIFEQGRRYDLICMDIMMPEMDGREAVRRVRAVEEAHGILSSQGAKIIMTTAVDDISEVALCFQELCDGYLVKPIDLSQLLGQMKSYQLVP